MSDQVARKSTVWAPHTQDDAAIAEAMRAADRGETLPAEAGVRYLRWLETGEDTGWDAASG